MIRRRLVLASAATTMLTGHRVGRASTLRRIRVFASPGAPVDALARRLAQSLNSTTGGLRQATVENVTFSSATPLTDFRFRRGQDLYVVASSQFKRIEQVGGLNISDFFVPVMSLGAQASVLVSSLQSRLTELGELGRVHGTLRLPTPAKLVSGPVRDLAPAFVWPRLAPRLKVSAVENDRASPSLMLANNEIDLATFFVDDLRPGKHTATLSGSSLLRGNVHFNLPSLEAFTSDLPINEEYLLAVDRTWSQAEKASLRQLLQDGAKDINAYVRQAIPSIQPSQLEATKFRGFINSLYWSNRGPTVVADDFLTCRAGNDCPQPRLAEEALTRISGRHLPAGRLAMCTDRTGGAGGEGGAGGGGGARVQQKPPPGVTAPLLPRDLCLDPRADGASADRSAAKKEDRSWWTTLKAVFSKDSDLRQVAPEVTVKWVDLMDEAMKAEPVREETKRKRNEPNEPKPED